MRSERARTILEVLRGSLRDMLSLLERIVQAESPSRDPAAQDAVLSILQDELADLDFDVTRVPGTATGGYLYAVQQPRIKRRPYQLLLGHCDTVWPLGTLAQMPFRIEEGTARGPGVFDMKGGLVQLIFALRALRTSAMRPEVTPVILINSDEEIGSRESGRQIARLARRADRALVLEPALGTSGRLKTSRRGSGKFYVRVQGRSAHSGLDPGAGASAILELSHVIQALHALNDPSSDISVNVGMIQGGVSSNVVAAESTAVVDVRVASKEDARRITQEIRRLKSVTPGTSIEITGRFGRDPMDATPRNRALWRRAQEAARDLGIDIDEGRSGGVSDANTTSLFTATLDGLGPVGDGAHAHHEYIEIEKMVERSALLALMVMQAPMAVHTKDGDTKAAQSAPQHA